MNLGAAGVLGNALTREFEIQGLINVSPLLEWSVDVHSNQVFINLV